MDWAVQKAEKSDVLGEQYHPYTGEPMSVSPLTWSHATFVIVVMEYLRKHELLARSGRAAAPAPADRQGALSS